MWMNGFMTDDQYEALPEVTTEYVLLPPSDPRCIQRADVSEGRSSQARGTGMQSGATDERDFSLESPLHQGAVPDYTPAPPPPVSAPPAAAAPAIDPSVLAQLEMLRQRLDQQEQWRQDQERRDAEHRQWTQQMAETLRNTQMANQGVFGYFAAAFSYLGQVVPGMPPMPPMALPSLVPPQGLQLPQTTAAPGMFTSMLSAPMTPTGQLSQSSLGSLFAGVSGMARPSQTGPSSTPFMSPGHYMTLSAFLMSTSPAVAPAQHITSVTRISSLLPVSALNFSGIESPSTSAPTTTSVVSPPVATEAVMTTSEVVQTVASESSSVHPEMVYLEALEDMLAAGYDEDVADDTAVRASGEIVSDSSSRSRSPSVHTASESELDEYTAELERTLAQPDTPTPVNRQIVMRFHTPRGSTWHESSDACLLRSCIWEKIQKIKLTRNMIVQTDLCFDSVEDHATNNCPINFLNSLTPNGLPPNELNLKINQLLILLCNLDPHNMIVGGAHVGERVFIPRILLFPSFKRKQFPARLSFEMIINKAQGQTITIVGVFLPESVFAHDQPYVALSRVMGFD
ncbi:hypothetical protein EJB05_01266, partial [Eragrostis curvula]